MRRVALLFMILLLTSAGYAQVSGGAGPTAPVAPIVSGFSNSVLDHNGNLLVLDVSYSYSTATPGQSIVDRLVPTIKTHVTVITSEGKKSSFDYDGSFQVIGAGRYAIYAIINTYSVVSGRAETIQRLNGDIDIVNIGGATVTGNAGIAAPVAVNTSRRLVALNANGGILPRAELLPSIDVPGRAEVRVSEVGDDSAADMIALVDSVSAPLPLNGSLPNFVPVLVSRTAQLWSFKGSAFQRINTTPIPLP